MNVPDQYVDQVREITDRGHLVIPGKRITRNFGIPLPDNSDEGVVLLPSPWCDLPAPCQTCGGEGVIGSTTDLNVNYFGPCLDCVAGRPVHLLQATCPTCHGTGAIEGRNIASWEDCWGDCNDGLLDLGLFTAIVMMVEVDPLGAIDWDEPPQPWEVIVASPDPGFAIVELMRQK